MILRHGSAEPDASNDDNRALTGAGRIQVDLVGQFIARYVTRPQRIAYSPLLRTTQTAEIIRAHVDVKMDVWPELIHSSNAAAVETKLMQLQCENILLVSHMPLVASLEAYLLDGKNIAGKPFCTAELSILSSDDAYPGGWRLEQRQVLS